MKLGRNNIGTNEQLNDIVDSMPYQSDFGMGNCGCTGLADAGVNLGVGTSGVNASGGFSWTTLLLIGAAIYLGKKYLK
jgi:hypothetical protein